MATQLDLDEDKKIELEDLLTVWSDESTTIKDGNKEEEDILHYLL